MQKSEPVPSGARSATEKVPRITAYFWVIKLLSTAAGEAIADFVYFDAPVNFIVGTLIEAGLFIFALVLQLSLRRYIAPAYWFSVLMVAVFGTTVADDIDYIVGIPLQWSTLIFAAATAMVMIVWFWREHSLSIHQISCGRPERFYWATVLGTFILGTAAGDLVAGSLGLGYFTSGIIFLAVFAIPAIGRKKLQWNATFSFWFAYILTRPIGASFADLFGMTRKAGGFGIGAGPVAAVLLLTILVLVAIVTIRRTDHPDHDVTP